MQVVAAGNYANVIFLAADRCLFPCARELLRAHHGLRRSTLQAGLMPGDIVGAARGLVRELVGHPG